MNFTFSYPKEFVEFYNSLSQNDKLKMCLDLEGISKDSFDVALLSNKYFQYLVSDVSIDANANMQDGRNPNNYQAEIGKPFLKLQGYYLLWEKLRDKFDIDEADRLLRKIVSGSYYMHDTTSAAMMNHYCSNISSTHLMVDGRQYGNLHSKPPKRSNSYLSSLTEVIMDLSNTQAGAVGVGDAIINYAYFSKKENRTDYDVTNDFQKLVHILLNNFRHGSQAVFLNLSIFDRYGILALFGDMAYPDGSKVADNIDEILRVQRLFVEFMAKGDPLRDGLPYKFPIVTLNITKDSSGVVLDPEHLKWISNINYPKGNFNIYVAEVGKVATCCFTEETGIYYDGILYTFKSLYEKFKDTIIKIDEKEANVIRMFRGNNKIHEIVTKSRRKMHVTEDHVFPTVQRDIYVQKEVVDKQVKDLTRDDYLLHFDLVYEPEIIKGIPDEIITNSITDRNDEFVYCIRFLDQNESCYFTLGNDILTHNCRLINNIEEKLELKGIDSFGNGGVEVGSSRVCTINVYRLAVKAIRKSSRVKRRFLEVFYMLLDEALEDVKEILLAHRKLLKERIDSGFLMFFKPLGWLNLDKHLFATIGLNGIAEAIKELEFDVIRNEDHRKLIGELLKYIDDKRKDFTKQTGIMFNVEQVPGETTAIKFAEKDFIFGYNKQQDGKIKYEIYANQFIPLTEDISIFDRIKVDGALVSKLSGGGISHINIQDQLRTPEQMETLINFCVLNGLEHFAINYGFGVCEDNHLSIVGNSSNVCSKCGKPIVDFYTRIVGYLTKVSSWTRIRREIEFPQRKFKNLTEN